MISDSYELLDSGASSKLERFGDRLLIRPSSLAVWKRRNPSLWDEAQAEFGQNEQWKFNGTTFEEWNFKNNEISLVLRLQNNGQVGLFPEHASYMSELKDLIKKSISAGREPALLNLFAYTGMCSVVAAKAGASVCHVDSSKSALDWATANFEKNEVNNVRLIREDALSFMRKEARRGKQYDFIVLDPPGFSRFRDGTWNVTDILPELCTLLTTLLSSKQGQAYFTFHGADLNGDTVRNILMDVGGTDPKHISWRQLSLIEKSGRVIPAGVLISAKACS